MSKSTPIHGSTAIVAMDHLKAMYWGMSRASRVAWVVVPIGSTLIVVAEFLAGADLDLLVVGLFFTVLVFPAIFLIGHWRLSEAQKQVHYEIDGEKIVIRDELGASVVVPWAMARSALEISSGFVVRLRPAGGRWLPKRAFSPDAVAALRRLIMDKLGTAAKVAA